MSSTKVVVSLFISPYFRELRTRYSDTLSIDFFKFRARREKIS